MDTKVTLSFDEEVVIKAKLFAQQNNISLSRLVEFLLSKAVSGDYPSLEAFPIASWVDMVAEGQAEYITRPRTAKKMKNEYFSSKK